MARVRMREKEDSHPNQEGMKCEVDEFPQLLAAEEEEEEEVEMRGRQVFQIMVDRARAVRAAKGALGNFRKQQRYALNFLASEDPLLSVGMRATVAIGSLQGGGTAKCIVRDTVFGWEAEDVGEEEGDEEEVGEEDGEEEGRKFVGLAQGMFHSIFLRADGSISSFGSNEFGQAPSGEREGSPYLMVTCGTRDSYGLLSNGSVECWGAQKEMLGLRLQGPFVSISAGHMHVVGLRGDGCIEIMGRYTNCDHRTPGKIGEEEAIANKVGGFVKAVAGYNHGCGLRVDGSVKCWGDNTFGQAPGAIRRAYGTEKYCKICCGYTFTAGLLCSGRIEVWGKLDNFLIDSFDGEVVAHGDDKLPAIILKGDFKRLAAAGDILAAQNKIDGTIALYGPFKKTEWKTCDVKGTFPNKCFPFL